MNRPHRRAAGFTLIELLVVVAIIALLISILLPALQRAREQGRITVCIANLRTIGQAANAYMLDFDDLPWALPIPYYADGRTWNAGAYTEFIWGGGMPDKRPIDWQATGESNRDSPIGCDVYRFPPRIRPMNSYLAPSVSWDTGRRDNDAGRLEFPMDLPGCFKCPSDSTVAVPTVGQQNRDLEGDLPFTTWSFWGSSYPINWYWPYYWWDGRYGLGTRVGEAMPYNKLFINIIGAGTDRQGNPIRGLGSRMLRRETGRFASEFVIFYENRLNYAMEGAAAPGMNNARAKMFKGWHKQFNYHSAAYRDGSARYVRYDTRYVWGTGWTTWPSRPWEDDWYQYNYKVPDDGTSGG